MELNMGEKKINTKVSKAKLKCPVIYVKDGDQIIVEQGTIVCVDIQSGVALIGEDHVDIYENEYEIFD